MLAKLPKQAQKSTIKPPGSSYGIGIVPCIPKFHYMKKVIFLPLLAMALFTVGCSKDNDDDDNGQSERMQLITSAAWKYDNAGIDLTGDEVGDFPVPESLLGDCDKDNVITLKADSTGTIDEGLTKCDPDDPQTVNITWEFKNNETVINVPQNIFGGVSGEVKIKTLTATKLTLVKVVPISDPTPGTATVVLDLKH